MKRHLTERELIEYRFKLASVPRMEKAALKISPRDVPEQKNVRLYGKSQLINVNHSFWNTVIINMSWMRRKIAAGDVTAGARRV